MLGRISGGAAIAAGMWCNADDAPVGGRVDEHCFVRAANFIVGREFVARPTDLSDRLQRTVRGAQPHASAHGRKRANALVENRAIKLSGCDRGASQLAKSGEYLFQLLPGVRFRIAAATGTARWVVGRRKMRRHITQYIRQRGLRSLLGWRVVPDLTQAMTSQPSFAAQRKQAGLFRSAVWHHSQSCASRTKNYPKWQRFIT